MVHINGTEDVCTQHNPALDCECRSSEGDWLEQATGTHDGTAFLTWLDRALEHARTQDQTKLVDYLEIIADDMIFEMEFAARNSS